jgi:hypothetical protein
MNVQLKPGRQIPGRCLDDLRALVQEVDGFALDTNGLETVKNTIKVLRANPAFAKRLLDLQ